MQLSRAGLAVLINLYLLRGADEEYFFQRILNLLWSLYMLEVRNILGFFVLFVLGYSPLCSYKKPCKI